MRLVAFLPLIMFFVVACGDTAPDPPTQSTAAASPSATAQGRAQTPVPTNTAAPRPTMTPVPGPTMTPVPAPTPEPSPTFAPGAVILPTVAISSPTAVTTDPLMQSLDAAGLLASTLRDLALSHPLDREFITREELQVRLREEFEEETDEIYKEQELYATLGILEEETDYYELLLTMYGEGVTGFFDTEEEKMYVVTDTSEVGPHVELTYAHEFTHGLQQQHFDIESLIDSVEDNNDQRLALRALIEGDATLLESLYYFERLTEEEQVEVQQAAQSTSLDAYRSAPYVVRRTFAFPYVEGPQFVISLFLPLQSWHFIDLAYEDYPLSTEQILHPERYTAGEEPVEVVLPDVAGALGLEWSQLEINTLGEFFLLTYLESGLDPDRASAAADGWGGDRYSLLKGPEDESLMVSLITWDSEEDALEFHGAFLEFMQQRTGADWELAEGEGMGQVMELVGQRIFLGLDGSDTLLILAPDLATLEAARQAVQDL